LSKSFLLDAIFFKLKPIYSCIVGAPMHMKPWYSWSESQRQSNNRWCKLTSMNHQFTNLCHRNKIQTGPLVASKLGDFNHL
jgi:hypothetical protein